MTRITKAMRMEFIRNAMSDAFEGRLAALTRKTAKFAAEEVRRQHPDFLAAHACPKTRPYLAVGHDVQVMADGVRCVKPVRWADVACSCASSGRTYSRSGAELMRVHALRPNYHDVAVDLKGQPDLLAEYRQFWSDFEEAQKTLTASIAAYFTRKKFESDFPELAKYLPQRPAPANTALAVQVGDVMQKLASVGIPPAVAGE